MGDKEFAGSCTRVEASPKLPPKNEILEKIMRLRETIEVAMETLKSMLENNLRSPQYEELERTVADLRVTEAKLTAIFANYPETSENCGAEGNAIAGSVTVEGHDMISQERKGAPCDSATVEHRTGSIDEHEQVDSVSSSDITGRNAPSSEAGTKQRLARLIDQVSFSRDVSSSSPLPDSDSLLRDLRELTLSSFASEEGTSSTHDLRPRVGFPDPPTPKEAFLEHLQLIHASIESPTERLLTVLAGLRLFFSQEEAAEVAVEFINVQENFWNAKRKADLDYLKRLTQSHFSTPDVLPVQPMNIRPSVPSIQNMRETEFDGSPKVNPNVNAIGSESGEEHRRLDLSQGTSEHRLQRVLAPDHDLVDPVNMEEQQTSQDDGTRNTERMSRSYPLMEARGVSDGSLLRPMPERPITAPGIGEQNRAGAVSSSTPGLRRFEPEGIEGFVMKEMRKYFNTTGRGDSASPHAQQRTQISSNEQYSGQNLNSTRDIDLTVEKRGIEGTQRNSNNHSLSGSPRTSNNEVTSAFRGNSNLTTTTPEKRKVKNWSLDCDMNEPQYNNLARPDLYGHNLSDVPLLSFPPTCGPNERYVDGNTTLPKRPFASYTGQQPSSTNGFACTGDMYDTFAQTSGLNSHTFRRERERDRSGRGTDDRREYIGSSTLDTLLNVMDFQKKEISATKAHTFTAMQRIARLEAELADLRSCHYDLMSIVYRGGDAASSNFMNSLNVSSGLNNYSLKPESEYGIADLRRGTRDTRSYLEHELQLSLRQPQDLGARNRERFSGGPVGGFISHSNTASKVTPLIQSPPPPHSFLTSLAPTGIAVSALDPTMDSSSTNTQGQRPGYSGSSFGTYCQGHSQHSNNGVLNNQVPPGNRANNYWDNFRSYSRQNMLSSPKFNGTLNSTNGGSEQRMSLSEDNNYNVATINKGRRRDVRNGAVGNRKMFTGSHFVENIGSKNRNEEEPSDENDGEDDDSEDEQSRNRN